MFVRFQIENFLSFNKKTEFSMIAGQSQKLSGHVIKSGKKDIGVLKTAVIYGANASGKSNFIRSVDFARELIVNGVDKVATFNKHFRLDPAKIHSPTSFEFEMKIGGKIYAYGFDIILKTKRIKEEWLFEVGKTSDKPIFNRKTNPDNSIAIDLNIKFDKKEHENRIKYIGLDCLPNQLFLTEISRKNVRTISKLKPILQTFEWFDDVLTVIYPHSKYQGIGLIGDDDKLSQAFCEFLQLFDTGVEGIEPQAVIFEKILKGFPDELKDDILQDFEDMDFDERRGILFGGDFYSIFKDKNGEIKFNRLLTLHSDSSNNKILFDLDDESDGTQRLFDLIPALFALTVAEKVFLIDELDRSLHPILSKKVIEIFLKNSAGRASQLVVTTHESSLLNLKLLRRDEIWFVEKDEKGESKLFSLEEFKPRHDKEIRKGYLHGRFGGIPVVGDVEELRWLAN